MSSSLHAFTFSRADELVYSHDTPLRTSEQETSSEETNSSEETTAGFIIDTWWSAIREA